MGIFDVFTGDPIKAAADVQQQALQRGQQQFDTSAGLGRGALVDNYTAALDPWMNLQGATQGGYQAYADATGANGPEGLSRARANFQAGPGFDFALNTGVDAISRSGVARGSATGNILQEAQKFGTGLANQEWGNYVNRLQPFLGQGTQIAGGIGNIYGNLGTALNANYMNQGQAQLGTAKGIGEAQAQGQLADYLGSQNLWNFGLNAAKTAASFMPGVGAVAAAMPTGRA